MIGPFVVLGRHVWRVARSMWRTDESRALLLLVAGLVALGSWFYHWVESFSWLDSVYFTVITLTTVGYGDLAPATAAGKIFTMFYVLVGVGLLIAFVSQVASHLIESRRADS